MLEVQKFDVQAWCADCICFLKCKDRFFYCYLFGWLNAILLAKQYTAHLLALNYVIFFARNVSVFHLPSQQKAEFLEKFVKINNILLSTQCEQDIQVRCLCLPPKLRIHYFIQKRCLWRVTYHGKAGDTMNNDGTSKSCWVGSGFLWSQVSISCTALCYSLVSVLRSAFAQTLECFWL